MNGSRRLPIFDAAVKVFAEKGFARATVEEIAKQAGIAKGTIYYNYKGKKELFLSLLEEGIERLEAAVSREVARKDTVLAKLEALVSAQLSFFEEYRDYCKILLSEVWGLGHRWEEQVQRLRSGYFKTIQELLEKGQAEGVIRDDLETETTAAAIFGAVGVAALDRFVFAQEYKYDQILQTLRQFLLKGVQAT
ncbi:MAG: Fatty acid metabolism regulator protein [Pelotomaculum sp. PtaB.Bin013]|uniref:TetR/AcrR family transcriptional regulator n=1 Tax=Pelotomaculum isophthalicicum JI TaxID=947010 RepID=A0A9X4JTM3_9FIRM|nr:TetR/AcrR family transcriptional regulator [Pelotomaculum isophthalicicum]MDF9408994.1 TetR/AcrR family transcriptional regulator [Pelotomaculum isophthalicicum JI]OPX91781.1 MAG: Fatty acid metabolism regulator protein [Pelotomaculum sp. PtaB.Bin013]